MNELVMALHRSAHQECLECGRDTKPRGRHAMTMCVPQDVARGRWVQVDGYACRACYLRGTRLIRLGKRREGQPAAGAGKE